MGVLLKDISVNSNTVSNLLYVTLMLTSEKAERSAVEKDQVSGIKDKENYTNFVCVEDLFESFIAVVYGHYNYHYLHVSSCHSSLKISRIRRYRSCHSLRSWNVWQVCVIFYWIVRAS